MHRPQGQDHQPRLPQRGDHRDADALGEQEARVLPHDPQNPRVRLPGPGPLVVAGEVGRGEHGDHRADGEEHGHSVGPLQAEGGDRHRAQDRPEEQPRAHRAAEQRHAAGQQPLRQHVDHVALPGEEEGRGRQPAQQERHAHEPQRGRPAGDPQGDDVEQPGAHERGPLPDAGDERPGGQDPDELADAGEGDDEGGRADARPELVGAQRRDRHDGTRGRGGEQGRPEGGYGDAPPAEGLALAHPGHPLLPRCRYVGRCQRRRPKECP